MSNQSLFERLEDTLVYRRLKYGINQELIHFFADHVLVGKDSLSVVEVACGSGFGSHLLGQRVEVKLSVASDIDMTLFNQSAMTDFNAKLVVSDIFQPSFQRNSFDLVWNSSSLEEIERPQEVLLSMAHLVKPGGYVYVGVPYLYGPLALYHVTPVPKWREWLGRPFTFDKLEAMLVACELIPVKRLTYFARFFAGVLAQKG